MKALGRRFELSTAEFDLSRHLSAALRPMSLLAALTAGGVAIVYLMGVAGILPETSGQILLGAMVLGLLAVIHRPIVVVAQEGHGTRAYWLHAVSTASAGILLAMLWDGATLVSLLMAWMSPLLLVPARVPRGRLVLPLALSVLATILVFVVSAQTGLPRMPAGTTASFATRLLVASMLVLFMLQFALTQVRRYKTLEARLVGSLVPIIAVPILFTTAIAAYNAFTSSQQQFQATLEAVASLKSGQVEELVN